MNFLESIKMAFVCGCNVSEQMLEMAYDKEVVQYKENDKFGMYIRHFDTDLAWFLKSPDRFRCEPSWFSWKNTQEVLYSRDDRRPFWSHLFLKVFRYKEIMARNNSKTTSSAPPVPPMGSLSSTVVTPTRLERKYSRRTKENTWSLPSSRWMVF